MTDGDAGPRPDGFQHDASDTGAAAPAPASGDAFTEADPPTVDDTAVNQVLSEAGHGPVPTTGRQAIVFKDSAKAAGAGSMAVKDSDHVEQNGGSEVKKMEIRNARFGSYTADGTPDGEAKTETAGKSTHKSLQSKIIPAKTAETEVERVEDQRRRQERGKRFAVPAELNPEAEEEGELKKKARHEPSVANASSNVSTANTAVLASKTSHPMDAAAKAKMEARAVCFNANGAASKSAESDIEAKKVARAERFK